MKETFIFKQLSLIIAMTASLTACSNSTPPLKETLEGHWKVNTIQESAVIKSSSVYLKFNQENKLSGSASCNNLSTSYTSHDNALTIAPIATTRKMCSPALMNQEALFLQSLNKVKRYKVDNRQLTMYDHQGQLIIAAKRTKAVSTK